MMQHFFREKNKKQRRTKLRLTQSRPFTHKRLKHETLEPRMMLSINPTGAEYLVNATAPSFQGLDGNVSSVAVSETAGTMAVYAGLGAARREGIFLSRPDGNGGANVELASSTIHGQRSAAVIAANDVGDTVVVWQGRGRGDKYGIFMQRYDAAGAKIGDETLVNQTTRGEQHDPAVAMADDGSFVVVWSGPTSADPAGIHARRFNADGTAAGDEQLVNTTTADDQVAAAIAMNGSGNYVITWSSRHQDGAGWGVFAQRFNSTGDRQGDEFQVNTTTAGSQTDSSVAMQEDGTFMVVWSSLGQDGDNWGVVARRFDATGTGVGEEFVVNTTTAGRQQHAQIAGAGDKYFVTWQSGSLDGSGWEVMAQEFDNVGNRVGGEQQVNSLIAGANSGHQQHPAVALNGAGDGAIIWSGYGTSDRHGVFGRDYQEDGPTEPNLSPDLATIPDRTVEPNVEMVVTVTATDPNAGDTLTYQLDPNHSPAGATIERTDNNTAVIRWTPTDADQNTVVTFRVLVTDNGEPPLADVEEFMVTVSDGTVLIDLNGPDEPGADTTATYFLNGDRTPIPIVDDDLLISGAANGTISSATAQFTFTRDGDILAVDTFGSETNITASYNQNTRTLTLTGEDTQENYQRVLRTLTFNTAVQFELGRTVEIQVNDGTEDSAIATVEIAIGTADLVGFAQALNAAFSTPDAVANNAGFYGAAWCPHCTAQKELFEDGGQFLPFHEVTNPNRTRNTLGDDLGINVYPTWIFPDGSRLENEQSLRTIAKKSGVEIPFSDTPFIAPLDDITLLVGSPTHVSLDGYDPNGGPLTYSVTTSNDSAVTAEILTGNRSARMQVAGYGDMVFELFEQRASRPTTRFIELANDDFYDGLSYHRILNDFVIQGGDPDGDGTGGSTLGDFDDQFHIDLQHNRTGLLSYAKSLDDTNDSQFFITEFTTPESQSSLRNLDFNHSIFGVLVEGEANRAAISDTAVTGPQNSTPVFNITMDEVEIFDDQENAVLFLKAAPGATGEVTVTVTVTDQQNNTFEETFVVTIKEDGIENLPVGVPDTTNGTPFLADITSPITMPRNTTIPIQLTGIDVEGDAVIYSAEKPAGNTVDYSFTVSPDGLVQVAPPVDFVGTFDIEVLVAKPGTDLTLPDQFRDREIDRQVLTIVVT